MERQYKTNKHAQNIVIQYDSYNIHISMERQYKANKHAQNIVIQLTPTIYT